MYLALFKCALPFDISICLQHVHGTCKLIHENKSKTESNKDLFLPKLLGMEVDEDIFDFLPAMVKKSMIYHCRVYIGVNKFSDFVLTGGNYPVLYEILGKQILSSLQLNGTILKGKGGIKH